MDRNGYLPKHNCKQCNNPLAEVERYLGIYTGLCTSCMLMPAYIISCYKIDNCLIISHPPNSVSHRRDRETHHAYIDCQVCKGTGRIYQSRGYASGGGYYHYCQTCLLERYYKHPMRVAYSKDAKEIYDTRITPFKLALDKQFLKIIPTALKEIEYSEYTNKDKMECSSVAKALLKQYDDFKESALRIPHMLYDKAYETIEYKPGDILLFER